MSRFLKKKQRFSFILSILERGSLDCLAFYLILLALLPESPATLWIHLIFPPLILADFLIQKEITQNYFFFFIELIIIGFLVYFGLKIQFITNPSGGFLYLDESTFILSYFWVLLLVSLINLFNFLQGFVLAISLVLAHTFLFSLFLQPTVLDYAFPLAAIVSAYSLLLWLFVILREKNPKTSPVLASSFSLVLGVLSVASTSKKIALLSIFLNLGIMAIPVIFFAFIIFYTHFQYKLKKQSLAEQKQVLWRFTTPSLNLFVVLSTITLYFICAVFLFSGKILWAIGLTVFATAIFLRLIRIVFIRKKIHYQDIFFTDEDFIHLFDTKIFRGVKTRAVEIAKEFCLEKEKKMHHIVTPDALCLFRTRNDKLFQKILKQADMGIPDGAGVLWASIFLRERPILERIPGIEFLRDLCSLSQKEKLGVYFLGSKEENLNEAIKRLKNDYPDLKISGQRNGYFQKEEENSVIEAINQSGASILFVALGVPAQEFFIDRNRNKLKVQIAMGIGGSLDVISGKIKRSPRIFQDFGLEWLWRTLKEPWRISRIYALPLYILFVFKEKLRIGDDETTGGSP